MYSRKKVTDGWAVLKDGKEFYVTDLATARRDVREFNKGAQSDGAPLFWFCGCLHANYQTSNNCEACGRPRR